MSLLLFMIKKMMNDKKNDEFKITEFLYSNEFVISAFKTGMPELPTNHFHDVKKKV